jgi:uncharacterized protein YjdB
MKKETLIYSVVLVVFVLTLFIGFSIKQPQTETLQVQQVKLSNQYKVLQTGEADILLAEVFPVNANNQDVEWSTSDNSVVSVKNGIITGVKQGTAQVFAVSKEGGHDDICYVHVV